MISNIHQKLGTAGFIISVVALVAALAGGAYAAKGGLTSKQKKEVQKIAKKFAGKQGLAGPAGSAGPAGPAGPAGAKGDKGDKGDTGSAGGTGPAGKSVVVKSHAPAGCTSGGVTYEVEGSNEKNEVCNGTTGYTEFLPSGKTETGTWAVGNISEVANYPGAGAPVHVPITYSIPLEAAIGVENVHYIGANGKEKYVLVPGETEPEELKEVSQPECPGTAAEPAAEPGNLCIYAGEETEVQTNKVIYQGSIVSSPIVSPASPQSVFGSAATGAILNIYSKGTTLSATGTFAVSAE